MTHKPVHVSDHALVRYLERVAGISLEIVRAEVRDLVRDAINAGATRVVVAGCIYELNPKARTVITVLPKGGKDPRCPSRVERHRLAERLK